MAKKTPAEIAHEKRLIARRARRAARKANEAIETQASSEAEAPAVNPRALGVKQQSVAASTPPKTLTQAREQLTQAFEDMGGVPELVRWGKKNPTEFYRIWARLIPKDVPAPETALPLETLLAKLAQRADMSIEEAARSIGQETLDQAEKAVNLEDAVAAFNGSVH